MTVTIEHIPTGRTFSVDQGRAALDTRGSVGLRSTLGQPLANGLVACVGCGVALGTRRGTTTTANGIRTAVATAELDRVVNDHAEFSVSERVGYGPATVVVACEACNGRQGDATMLRRLADAALAALVAHGTETTIGGAPVADDMTDADWLAATLASIG